MTLIKNGALTPYELGEQGYLAFRLVGSAIGSTEPAWNEIADNTLRAWIEACTEYTTDLRHLAGEHWQEIARRMYERLAIHGAWPEHPGPFGNQSPRLRLQMECVARHLFNCHQIDDGEDLEDFATQLVPRAQKWLDKLAGNHPQHA